jgi:flagella basal body P-ring formation protein FlgA
MAVLAVLLIVLGAAVAGLLAVRIDNRTPVLVARRTISVGQRISSSDLAVARIASDGIAVIPADQANQVVGHYAGTQISAGRLLDASMLTTRSLLTSGNAAVGVSLQPGRFPASGLQTGDVVQVVRAVDGTGKVISTHAVVGSVQTSGNSVFGSNGSDTVVITVIVSQSDATAVAAASAADQASLVLLQRGTTVGSG